MTNEPYSALEQLTIIEKLEVSGVRPPGSAAAFRAFLVVSGELPEETMRGTQRLEDKIGGLSVRVAEVEAVLASLLPTLQASNTKSERVLKVLTKMGDALSSSNATQEQTTALLNEVVRQLTEAEGRGLN